MSSKESNLSPYNYGIVVATSESSINATMKEYLASLSEPVVARCYVADPNGNPVDIDYEELKTKAKGTDPFAIPANADPNGKDIKNLESARFMSGFKARIGIPENASPADIPNIITLPDKTGNVTFNLMCSQFQIVNLKVSGGYSTKTSWVNISQPDDKPWLFQSLVDLNLSTVDKSHYESLPSDVQKKIKSIGAEAFSIQQLLFDLDNAALSSSVPKIEGVDDVHLKTLLNEYFMGAYLAEMKKKALPILGVSMTHHEPATSTLTVTDLNITNNPYMGANGQPVSTPTPEQQNASTLNYLCAVNQDPLPSARNFTWNWIDISAEGKYDGVVAINRDTFVGYFRRRLNSIVKPNCFNPKVDVTGGAYSWSLIPGQNPTVHTPPSGSTVLSYSYQSPTASSKSLWGLLGSLSMTCSYDMFVKFLQNTITIEQHMVVHIEVEGEILTKFTGLPLSGGSYQGNIIDKAITDTYKLEVTDNGNLVVTLLEPPDYRDDAAKPPSGFFNKLFNSEAIGVEEYIQKEMKNYLSTKMTDIPAGDIKNFVFPGGKTFLFKEVAFSDHQDLVAHITYADPT